MYTAGMDIALTQLRSNLSDCVSRARAGEEVVVTDRGLPVAKLVGLDAAPLVERLTEQGLLSRPETSVRPKASGRMRPRARRSASDQVSEQRR
jgi:prevent-host-death family protein